MYQEKPAELLKEMVVGCISNDRGILSANLMNSPAIRSGRLLAQVEENPQSAAKGYNSILQQTDASFAILAHQDVFLPEGWEQLLASRIAEVEAVDPNWG